MGVKPKIPAGIFSLTGNTVPSLFSRLSSVFGRLQNPVLLVLSSKNSKFRRPSKPSAF